MLFLTYWELNENMPEQQRLEVAQKITSSEELSSEVVNMIRWDITPDGWGISIFEAEKASDIFKSWMYGVLRLLDFPSLRKPHLPYPRKRPCPKESS